MKSSEFKECFRDVKPSKIQKQHMFEQTLKPRDKHLKKWWLLAPALCVLLAMGWIIMPTEQQIIHNSMDEEASHRLSDQVTSFEFLGDTYLATGQWVDESVVGRELGGIEISKVPELIGCPIFESTQPDDVIVKWQNGYELFIREES